MKYTNQLLVIILLISCLEVWSQDFPRYRPWTGSDYGPAEVFPTNLIADDFGPRKYDDNWHGGVDYNGDVDGDLTDKGDMILAVEGGTIVDVNHMRTGKTGIRYPVVDAGDHRWCYVHEFNNSKDDD
jgi:hypothetical protein